MQRHSILFKINMIFAIAFLALLLIASFTFHFESERQRHDLFDRLSNIAKALSVDEWKTQTQTLHKLALSQGLEVVEEPMRSQVMANAIQRHPPNITPEFLPPMIPLSYKEREYILYKRNGVEFLFQDKEEGSKHFPIVTTVMVLLMLLLSILYNFVRKSISPIQMMREQIKAYGEGKMIKKLEIEKKDEISILYQEFYQSVQKLHNMENSRKLFLRNIMHELNTPIAKGKLIAAMADIKNKRILNNIFERLEMLVKELASVEKFSSSNYELKMRSYPIIELIDHAKDMLYIEKNLSNDVDLQKIDCDFDMMSIVFKNLIDNSLKHGKNSFISYKEGSICFSSEGEILKHPLEHYTQAFIKGDGFETSQEGLGLGLYIVNDLLNKQGYRLQYFYENNMNYFKIEKSEK
ncbi:ArsS family sensor histidine kinase [Sulfurimonas microaerophilic]|uniref:ArsS family sensor histidine kinase n=1 Tax=Sulfurimonas microaerophilic TaxID=3058392 RepID=UPI0027147828|nr:ArsS family sensor histidine kinase [Sulfurimonas sp. hsl 1-7]